jgi:hypothetical protein
MGVNYLHNFTSVLDDALKKYNGISQALEIDKPDEFHKEDTYKNAIVDFRKNLRTKRLITITEVMDVIKEFVTDETLTLYSIEKAFNFVKQYENSEKSIKSLMNKFDKTLRNSIDKEILDQFGITARIRRSSRNGKEGSEAYELINKTKSSQSPQPWYDKNTKAPEWYVNIIIPIEHIRVTGQFIDQSIDVEVPYLTTHANDTYEHPEIHLRIDYKFDSFTEFFINSISRLEEYSKDINLFIKDLMKANQRQLSFDANVHKSLYGRRDNDHPYVDNSGRGSNWCTGQLKTELEKAYSSMNITEIALSTHRWLTTYDLNHTHPHRQINKFYNWLPTSAGTGVESMPHSQNQANACWEVHKSKTVCETRACAFVASCERYNDVNIDEPVIDDRRATAPIPSDIDEIRNTYVADLAMIYSLPDHEYRELREETRYYGLCETEDGELASTEECVANWEEHTNILFVRDLPQVLLTRFLTNINELLPRRENEQPLNEGPL